MSEFLEASMREADTIADDDEAASYFLAALGDAACAEGAMTDIAERSGMSRTSVYRSLCDSANPSFRSVMQALRELGANLAVVPMQSPAAA